MPASLSVCALVDDVVRDAFELRFENLCIAVLKEGGRKSVQTEGKRDSISKSNHFVSSHLLCALTIAESNSAESVGSQSIEYIFTIINNSIGSCSSLFVCSPVHGIVFDLPSPFH